MEHRIYNIINKYKIPLFIRVLIMVLLILFWILALFFPLPGSAIFWIILIVIWLLFIIWVKDIKNIKKIRKWIIFFSKNIIHKDIRKHKIKDIKKHIKEIQSNNKKQCSKKQ